MTALSSYASQIASLFGDEAKMRESLTAQSLRMSGRWDMCGEKMWKVE